MTSEVLVVQVGQGGIQLGNSVWELLCIEHAIGPDGENLSDSKEINMKTFFCEVKDSKYCPRALFVDSEPTVVDEIRTGAYRTLYHPDQLINAKEDAGNNFARGSFFSGNEVLKLFKLRMHKLTEQSDSLESFLMLNSVGGGSGSGIGSLLLQQIVLDYPKVSRMQMPIFSGPIMGNAVVEPYNSILHTHTTMETVDLAILFDNEALYEMCSKLLFMNTPAFIDLNRLLALMISSITCTMRYETASHTSLKEIRTNLIPYPRIHFPLVRHAPLEHRSRCTYSPMTVEEITRSVFSRMNQSLICDTNRGRYIAIIVNYRGHVNPREAFEAINKQKSSISNFVEWCPTGYKLSINHHGPVIVPESQIALTDKGVTMLCNTTAIKELWIRMGRKFDLLFQKKAFMHWFMQEGMEEIEFGESRMDMQLLVEDYEEIGMTEQEMVNVGDDFRKSRTKSSHETVGREN